MGDGQDKRAGPLRAVAVAGSPVLGGGQDVRRELRRGADGRACHLVGRVGRKSFLECTVAHARAQALAPHDERQRMGLGCRRALDRDTALCGDVFRRAGVRLHHGPLASRQRHDMAAHDDHVELRAMGIYHAGLPAGRVAVRSVVAICIFRNQLPQKLREDRRGWDG